MRSPPRPVAAYGMKGRRLLRIRSVTAYPVLEFGANGARRDHRQGAEWTPKCPPEAGREHRLYLMLGNSEPADAAHGDGRGRARTVARSWAAPGAARWSRRPVTFRRPDVHGTATAEGPGPRGGRVATVLYAVPAEARAVGSEPLSPGVDRFRRAPAAERSPVARAPVVSYTPCARRGNRRRGYRSCGAATRDACAVRTCWPARRKFSE